MEERPIPHPGGRPPPWGLAALMGWGALRALRQRQAGIIDVRPEGFHIASRTIGRGEVTSVRRRKDLSFDGVEIAFTDGGGVRIPRAQHDPDDVLRAFRGAGYPPAED